MEQVTLDTYIAFAEACGLNKFHRQKKSKIDHLYGQEYGWFKIISVQNDNWWYKDFIDLEFFGLIHRSYSTKESKAVFPVRLIGHTFVEKWNDIDIKDVILL